MDADAAAFAGAVPNPWEGFRWTKKDQDGRTHEPIHAGSRPSLGANEAARRISERQREGWLEAFDRHARTARPAGKRRGNRDPETGRYTCYSHAARQVLAYFLDLAVNTGRIFPSYNHIARVLDIPRSLVHRILAQLEQMGWIKRERRFREAATAGGEGPQLAQDTNWYTVHLPDAAANLLAAWRRRDLDAEEAPLSAEEQAARQRARARETLGRQRRALEQNLARVRGFLDRASDARARRKLQESVDELEVQIADSLRREAALSELGAERFLARARALFPSESPMRVVNPPPERI